MTSRIPNHLDVHYRLMSDLPYYARHASKIKDKEGNLVPFILNKAQLYLHAQCEKQLKARGYVRVIILKGRKQGMSSYVGDRYFHKATTIPGREVFILSHEAKTTDVLFRMVTRFYENLPDPLKPPVSTKNRNQLAFSGLDSIYTIGTAGNEDVGRGGTPHLFHGSEVAFWANTAEIRSGILNSVPKSKGTEIILESTANGQKDMFYEMCMDALDGKGDYELVFIPWFWQDEYRDPIPKQFSPTQEEEELKTLYNLDNGQLHWRRMKISELGGISRFMQEYPCNVIEAFQTTGTSLVSAERAMAARKSKVTAKDSPMVLGVDPGRTRDKTTLVFRRGREIPFYEKYDEMDEMRLAGIVANHIEKHNLRKVFIDVGLGYGTIDRLRELGFGKIVVAVNFGAKADNDESFMNKRAEMAIRARDWFNEDVSIPDDEFFYAGIRAMPDFERTSAGKIYFKPKDQIRKDIGMSTDVFDGTMLTFAELVYSEDRVQRVRQATTPQNYESPFKTLNRARGIKINNTELRTTMSW